MRGWRRVLEQVEAGPPMSRDDLLRARSTLDAEARRDPSLRLQYLYDVIDARLHSLDTGTPYAPPAPPEGLMSPGQAERAINRITVVTAALIALGVVALLALGVALTQ